MNGILNVIKTHYKYLILLAMLGILAGVIGGVTGLVIDAWFS